MLERLMAASLRNRLLVGLGLVLVVAIGTWSIATIPIDAFPDVTNIQVEVISTAPGLSPLEIERAVTYPIETAMRGLPGLVTMRSATKYGISVVTLVFRDDIDIYFARQQVHERVSDVSRKPARRRGNRDGADRHGHGRDLPVHAGAGRSGAPRQRPARRVGREACAS